MIKRRLGALEDLIREFSLKITVTLVQSQKNKANMLTRGKKTCLQEKKGTDPECCVGEDLKDLHNMRHFGKERTLYLARKVNPNITMEAAVEQCRVCQSIDPASSRHERKWLAIDITHYHHEP